MHIPQHIKYRMAPAPYPITIGNLYDDISLVSSSTLEGTTLVKSLHRVSSDSDEWRSSGCHENDPSSMLGRESKWNEQESGCSREGGLSDERLGMLGMPEKGGGMEEAGAEPQ